MAMAAVCVVVPYPLDLLQRPRRASVQSLQKPIIGLLAVIFPVHVDIEGLVEQIFLAGDNIGDIPQGDRSMRHR